MRKTRSYSPQFKARLVAMVLDDGQAVSAVARDWGVHGPTLHGWVRKEREARGIVPAPDPESSAQVVDQLRTRVVQLEDAMDKIEEILQSLK